ncbi:unnamed protein product [Auanema sp. JU1783]|nr:unnamed protein product [Auanema sp. JU1783]
MSSSPELVISEEELRIIQEHIYGRYGEFPEVDVGDEIVQCTSGVLGSLQVELFRLVMLTMCQRLIQLTCFPDLIKLLFIICCGVYALCDFVKNDHLFNIVLLFPAACLVYILAAPLPKKGLFVTLFSMALLISLEARYDASETSAIRGILMSLIMRLSSFAFDYENGIIPLTGTISYFAYLFNPAAIIFGPFCTFIDFVETFRKNSFKRELYVWIVSFVCIVLSLCSVLLSSCSSIFETESMLINDYIGAFSFRTSHYFICLFSQGLFWLTGGTGWVVHPMSVEAPRSVVDIVVAWNIPMHKYLKNYVYKPVGQLGHTSLAIGLTFLVSSLLHGLNIKLSLVLLSLGYLTWVESVLRYRLSNVLSACIRARPCVDDCNHLRKYNNWFTRAANGFFALLAVYHLIYLGMIFDGQDVEHDTFYAVFTKWSSHSFASVKIALVAHVTLLVVQQLFPPSDS